MTGRRRKATAEAKGTTGRPAAGSRHVHGARLALDDGEGHRDVAPAAASAALAAMGAGGAVDRTGAGHGGEGREARGGVVEGGRRLGDVRGKVGRRKLAGLLAAVDEVGAEACFGKLPEGGGAVARLGLDGIAWGVAMGPRAAARIAAAGRRIGEAPEAMDWGRTTFVSYPDAVASFSGTARATFVRVVGGEGGAACADMVALAECAGDRWIDAAGLREREAWGWWDIDVAASTGLGPWIADVLAAETRRHVGDASLRCVREGMPQRGPTIDGKERWRDPAEILVARILWFAATAVGPVRARRYVGGCHPTLESAYVEMDVTVDARHPFPMAETSATLRAAVAGPARIRTLGRMRAAGAPAELLEEAEGAWGGAG